MINKEYIFNESVFDSMLQEAQELTPSKINGQVIISTIYPYVDCEAEFVMSLTDEDLDSALEILDDINNIELLDMAAATKVANILNGIKNKRIIKSRDLF